MFKQVVTIDAMIDDPRVRGLLERDEANLELPTERTVGQHFVYDPENGSGRFGVNRNEWNAVLSSCNHSTVATGLTIALWGHYIFVMEVGFHPARNDAALTIRRFDSLQEAKQIFDKIDKASTKEAEALRESKKALAAVLH